MTSWLDPYIGPAAGLTTSVLWTATSICFTSASRRLGAALVNVLRIGLAIVWLALTHRFLTGTWIPPANNRQVVYLALSGLVGLSIGDWALFAAFVYIGPRLGMLMMTTAPIMAAVIGWLILGEGLGLTACLGMVLTVAGVGWVVFERPAAGDTPFAGPGRNTGLLLGLFAAVCQAIGLLLSKQGIGHGWLPTAQHLTPQAATLTRMVFAGVFAVPTVAILHFRQRGTAGRSRATADPHALRVGLLLTLCGSVVGPFLGIWMSLVATDRCPLGVAQTLISLSPVLILPLTRVLYKERITARAVCGAIVAVGGIAVMLWPAPSA
jgi:drug/metabolite transporter (DMT)-like permease